MLHRNLLQNTAISRWVVQISKSVHYQAPEPFSICFEVW